MDKRRGGERKHSERDFAYLSPKSPVELLDELEAKIDSMTAEEFDTGLVEAYLAALQEKAPVMTGFDPEQSYKEFADKHAVLLQNLAADAPRSGKAKRPYRSKLRSAYAAAIILVILFSGTITANAYGINVFEKIIVWGEEILKIGRGDDTISGVLELPVGRGAAYRSMTDALEKHGLSADVCPTWIPERYKLMMVDVQEDGGELLFNAVYQDEKGNRLLFAIDYAPDSEAIYAIEKDPDGQTYQDNGVEYYLVKNIGKWKATWLDSTCFYSLSGDVTKQELMQMLDSIYER